MDKKQKSKKLKYRKEYLKAQSTLEVVMVIMIKVAQRLSLHHRMIFPSSSSSFKAATMLHPSRRRCLGQSLSNYSTTRSLSAAWRWNPFSRNNAQVGSAKTTSNDASSFRTIQERKDTILVILAMEFRRLSLLASENIVSEEEREKLVDKAFTSLEEMQLDSKSLIQLRHTLQESLQGYVFNS